MVSCTLYLLVARAIAGFGTKVIRRFIFGRKIQY